MMDNILFELTKSRLIFTFKGIPLYISSVLIVFLGIITCMLAFSDEFILIPIFWFVMTTAYGLVVLHEYGHALTAGHYGYPCDNITLYPFMGAASVPLSYDNPKAEFWITLNGPLVNFVLALASLPFVWLFPESFPVTFFFETNVILLAFNMVPCYPMDGGRLLRSLLGLNLKDHWKAARISYYFTLVILPFFVTFVYFYFSGVAAVLVGFMGAMCYFEFQMNKEQHENKTKIDNRIKTLLAVPNTTTLTVEINNLTHDIPAHYEEATASFVYYDELAMILGKRPFRNNKEVSTTLQLICDLKNLTTQEKEWFQSGVGQPMSLQRCISKKILKSRLVGLI